MQGFDKKNLLTEVLKMMKNKQKKLKSKWVWDQEKNYCSELTCQIGSCVMFTWRTFTQGQKIIWEGDGQVDLTKIGSSCTVFNGTV